LEVREGVRAVFFATSRLGSREVESEEKIEEVREV
jgi:hypothetical protein